jgi:hypothetical protein
MNLRRTLSLCWVLLASLAAFAQNSPPVSTVQATFPVYSANIQPVTQASTVLVGNPGPQTYYYWLVTKYTLGDSSPIGPFVVSGAPNTLSVSNYVAVTPVYLLGIASVSLLRTSTATPPVGACNCAVATAVTSGTINDQANSLNAYTVSPVITSQFNLTLTNEVTGTGSTHLILRQNGALVQDLSLTGGSGFAAGGDLTGTPSSQTVSGILNKALPTLSTGFLNYNGTNWVFSASPGFTAGGDLSGTSSSQTVSGLLTKALPSLATGFLNYTGSVWAFSTNIPTASALAAVPALCGVGNAPTGILANGNATGCAPIAAGSFTAANDLTGTNVSQTVLGSSAVTMYVPPGTQSAPGVFISNAPKIGFYAAAIRNTWNVTGTSSSAGTATVTITSPAGFTFSFTPNQDYIVTSGIGGGYDCALSAPCLITASNSGTGTISYVSPGVGNQTSGTVNQYTVGIQGKRAQFQSLQSTTFNAANGNCSLCLAAGDNVVSHDVPNNADVVLLIKNNDASTADTRAAQVGDNVFGAMTHLNAPFAFGGPVSSNRPWNMFSANTGSNFSSSLNMSGFVLANDGRFYMTDTGLGATDPWGQVIHPTQPGAAANSYSPGTVNQAIVFSATGIPKFYNLPAATCLGVGYTPVASGGPLLPCGLPTGTSGGIPGYTATGTIASSVALTLNTLTKGGGPGATPSNSSIVDNGTSISTGEPLSAGPLTSAGGGSGTWQGVQGAALSACPTNTPNCIQPNAWFLTVPAVITTSNGWTVPATAPVAAGPILVGVASGTPLTSQLSYGTLSNAAGTKLATSTGALTNGDIVSLNASGDYVDSGTALSALITTATCGTGTVLNGATCTATPTLGVAGTTAGTLTLSGLTSGSVALGSTATGTALTINQGIALSGAQGAATTLSTTTTNAGLLLSPNGTGPVIFNNGAVATPSRQYAAWAANTGWYEQGVTSECLSTTGVATICFFGANGIQIGGNKSYALAAANGASGTQGLGISASNVGVNTSWSFDTSTAGNEAALLRWNTCKVNADITLSTSATNICSWTLPAVAKTWAYQCQIPWSVTAGTTPTLSIGVNASQTPTGTTNASAEIKTTNTNTATEATAALSASGALNVLTSPTLTTAATIFMSSASGTLLASATSGTFAITMTGTGASFAGVARAGATCELY